MPQATQSPEAAAPCGQKRPAETQKRMKKKRARPAMMAERAGPALRALVAAPATN